VRRRGERGVAWHLHEEVAERPRHREILRLEALFLRREEDRRELAARILRRERRVHLGEPLRLHRHHVAARAELEDLRRLAAIH